MKMATAICLGLRDTSIYFAGDEKTWMDRPHIRFIGETGKEDTKWYNHKQQPGELSVLSFWGCTASGRSFFECKDSLLELIDKKV